MTKHLEQRILPYAPEKLFNLVADVPRYPEFLPWCVGARVIKREGEIFYADVIIGFSVFRETFTSRVTLATDKSRIDTVYTRGPFRHLRSYWVFKPHSLGCEVEFFIDFEFKSGLLQKAMEGLFHEAARRMVSAFEKRAADLYRPS